MCFSPKKHKTSGFIVFLQIAFCFYSLKIDNWKDENWVGIQWYDNTPGLNACVTSFSLFSSLFLCFVTSLRKFTFRTLLSETQRARWHSLLARKRQLFSLGWELWRWLLCKVHIIFLKTTIWHCVKSRGFYVESVCKIFWKCRQLKISGPQFPHL